LRHDSAFMESADGMCRMRASIDAFENDELDRRETAAMCIRPGLPEKLDARSAG
jgi:hypothetical protein